MLNFLEGSTIELNHTQYYVRDSQVGEEGVLLIHGWPDDGTVWHQQVPALIEAGYRVICPDLLGYGLSEAPEAIERYQLSYLVNDLILYHFS